MDTFRISRSRVQQLQHLLQNGTIVAHDARGKHGNQFKNSANLRQAILNHINGFPKYSCHYSRRNHEEYLSPDLTVIKMFRLFVQQNPNLPGVEKKETLYRQIFKEANIRIGIPKSDTCSSCDRLVMEVRLAAQGSRIRLDAESQQSLHHAMADAAHLELTDDIRKSRADPSYVVKCGDLEKVLFTPTLLHSEMYYKRQLSTFNFCIYNGGDDSSDMYMWSETVGNRGVDEIGSCILKNIEDNFARLQIGESRVLIFWSDRCRGQVNNFQLLTLFKYLIQRQYFTKIEQKFLHSGHSFMPCDRQFALIEKNKKKTPAMVPNDWMRIVSETKITEPFRVHEITQADIMNIGLLEQVIPRPRDLKVTQNMKYLMKSDEPHLIYARSDHLPGIWLPPFTIHRPYSRQNFQNRPLWRHQDMHNFNLAQKYNRLIPISREKYQDLQTMVPLLPPQYRNFYINLPHL